MNTAAMLDKLFAPSGEFPVISKLVARLRSLPAQRKSDLLAVLESVLKEFAE